MRPAAWIVLAFSLVAIACRDEAPPTDRYLPSPEAARGAVVAALTAWKDGQSPGPVSGTRPLVCVVDHYRRPGQRLANFEVLGEVAVEHGRAFAVRLTLENPDEQPVIHYLAIGIDPLWVYRREDFEDMSHWMHKMDDPEAADAEEGTKASPKGEAAGEGPGSPDPRGPSSSDGRAGVPVPLVVPADQAGKPSPSPR